MGKKKKKKKTHQPFWSALPDCCYLAVYDIDRGRAAGVNQAVGSKSLAGEAGVPGAGGSAHW